MKLELNLFTGPSDAIRKVAKQKTIYNLPNGVPVATLSKRDQTYRLVYTGLKLVSIRPTTTAACRQGGRTDYAIRMEGDTTQQNRFFFLYMCFTSAQFSLVKVGALYFAKLSILDPVGASWDNSDAASHAKEWSRYHSSDDYWKFAQSERHFNETQAGIRNHAATWTLAAFASIAILLKSEEKLNWLVSPAVLVCVVSVMATLGLLVLWLCLLDLVGASWATFASDYPARQTVKLIREAGILEVVTRAKVLAKCVGLITNAIRRDLQDRGRACGTRAREQAQA